MRIEHVYTSARVPHVRSSRDGLRLGLLTSADQYERYSGSRALAPAGRDAPCETRYGSLLPL